MTYKGYIEYTPFLFLQFKFIHFYGIVLTYTKKRLYVRCVSILCMPKKKSFSIILVVCSLISLLGIAVFISLYSSTEALTTTSPSKQPPTESHRKRIVIHLDAMTITLIDATGTRLLPIVSKGKPTSYYETIGGVYTNDYKYPLHFSSIGHVYMPYSVHIFGNYFIHGIPYYPNGSKVSSAYSGGCIRLSDDDAKTVYDFVETGTPIILTQGNEEDFLPTPVSTSTLSSIEMTTLMVATVSLEALAQDTTIVDISGDLTTRKTLLPKLIRAGDQTVSHTYEQSIVDASFVQLMNTKASALGLTNTHFYDATSSVTTTYDDYERFMTYISTYKSYIRGFTF